MKRTVFAEQCGAESPSGELNNIIGSFVAARCLVPPLSMTMQNIGGTLLYQLCILFIQYKSLQDGLLASQVNINPSGHRGATREQLRFKGELQ